MSTLDLISKPKENRPRRCVIYGTHGVGKSTLAASFPDPVFVSTEDGIGDIDAPSFPLCRTTGEAWQYLVDLAGGQHEFATVVVDSLDWLQQIMADELCKEKGKESLTDFDYGKGGGLVASRFGHFLKNFNACRSIGMHVVLIAHCHEVKVEPPGSESYTRYSPKLLPAIGAMVQEWADEVFLLGYKTWTKPIDEGFGRTRHVAIGGNRVIYTSEQPGLLAKNRCGLPAEMDCEMAPYRAVLDRVPKRERKQV